MPRFIYAILTIVILFSPLAAEAQSTWVQVEARPTLAEAEARARTYSQTFPSVAGFRLRSGWYAIALGPFPQERAVAELRALLAERLIPPDSFVADGSTYGQRFWPTVGAATPDLPAPDPAPPGATAAPVPVPPPAPIDETPAEARRSEAQLSRPEREVIQTALEWEGFYRASIDGAFGPGTRSAMSAWQAAKGYEATGVLTARQRAELVGGYRAVTESLGLAPVRDNTAGIEVSMPTRLVQKGDYQPPFAHYPGQDGFGVILISQGGDQATLMGLYEILQTLEIMPLEGPREARAQSFTIEGTDDRIVSYAEARLTPAGRVKGFILTWPTGDERRRALTLATMRKTFTILPDAVLADDPSSGIQGIDLLAGLQIRRPDVSRSGFYLDAAGHVLTTADAVAACTRITLDDDVAAQVLGVDTALGIAVLKPQSPLSPRVHARFEPGEPRPQSEVAVSGYSFDGRLGAAVLTFGRFADVRGLDGEEHLSRLVLKATPGDAGGPVLDGAGSVIGVLLPAMAGARVLPDDVSFAADAVAVVGFLSGLGLRAAAAEPRSDLSPEALTRLARAMTVHVACWN